MNYVRKSLSGQELLCTFEDILDRSPALVLARNLGDATMTTILFADNDPEFLKTRAEFLRQEGYQVIPALNPTEARRLLERGEMNLAILDIRLENDDDEKDISGLILAREVGHSIPKIILTGFPCHDHVREALGPQLRGLPAAVDFVAKQEGPEALLRAVRGTL
jgi:CheY-like chemotaxis protein